MKPPVRGVPSRPTTATRIEQPVAALRSRAPQPRRDGQRIVERGRQAGPSPDDPTRMVSPISGPPMMVLPPWPPPSALPRVPPFLDPPASLPGETPPQRREPILSRAQVAVALVHVELERELRLSRMLATARGPITTAPGQVLVARYRGSEGSHFHRDPCHRLQGRVTACSLLTALKRGLSHCPYCLPQRRTQSSPAPPGLDSTVLRTSGSTAHPSDKVKTSGSGAIHSAHQAGRPGVSPLPQMRMDRPLSRCPNRR